MASHRCKFWMVLITVVAAAFLVSGTRTDGRAAEPGALAGAPEKMQVNARMAQARSCPGCDADQVPGTCTNELSPEEAEASVRIPYGVGASGYRDMSGINKANRIIGRSSRSLNDSIRRMNDSINRIRNIHRRF